MAAKAPRDVEQVLLPADEKWFFRGPPCSQESCAGLTRFLLEAFGAERKPLPSRLAEPIHRLISLKGDGNEKSLESYVMCAAWIIVLGPAQELCHLGRVCIRPQSPEP